MQLGMYVVVSDLSASSAFYGSLFQTEPYVENEALVAFNVSGSPFALFHESAFEHDLVRGNNAIPYVRVDDIDAEFDRVRGSAAEMIHDRVVDEGVIRLFMFADPDGNAIEFYSLTRPSG